MPGLPDALFPPLDENGNEDEESTERHIYSLLDSIQTNPQPGDAVTAAVLIQHEVARWKRAIAALERRVDTTPAIVADDSITELPQHQLSSDSYVTDDNCDVDRASSNTQLCASRKTEDSSKSAAASSAK